VLNVEASCHDGAVAVALPVAVARVIRDRCGRARDEAAEGFTTMAAPSSGASAAVRITMAEDTAVITPLKRANAGPSTHARVAAHLWVCLFVSSFAPPACDLFVVSPRRGDKPA
jgi:hypothetical protein